MVILDSNVWVAYLNKNDTQHKKAEKVFLSIGDDMIAITEYLIVEVCSVLALRVNKKSADNFLRLALDNKNIEIILSSEDFFVNCANSFSTDCSGKLSFVDCSLLYLSELYSIITFDQALRKLIEK